MIKIHIQDRNYSEWTCMDVVTFKPIEIPDFHPAKYKFMTNDVFSMENDEIKLEHSTSRELENIPGVLDLKSNKTYGREKDNQHRLLYKVVPDDMRLPVFLVPYQQKHIGFSKVFVNVYVTFKFVAWDGKHPVGKLTSTIGPVDTLPNFYEYQLYCRSLNASFQNFNKVTSKSVKKLSQTFGIDGIMDKYPSIEDRRGEEWHVITIDPLNSTDFDDGFSLKQYKPDIGEDGSDKVLLSIYISNVTILLDVLNLWESFSRRVSTIYLPDRKRPMLPNMLSDNLCSLQENSTRFAFAMDIVVNIHTGEIEDVSFVNCAIRVFKNYRYEEPALQRESMYSRLFDVSCLLSEKYKYIQQIKNSHDVVCYLMTLMNYYSAKNLLTFKNGIFRSSVLKNDNFDVPQDLDAEVEKFVKIWYSSGGCYIDAETIDTDVSIVRHELINMDAYVHITSPIRRLVDLLNMIKFQENNNMIALSEKASTFYKQWTSKSELEYVNVTMRSIKKVQNDCSMLEFYSKNTDTLDENYEGVIFDKILRNDGSYQFIVYLPKLRLNLRVNLHKEYQNFEKHMFKLYLFEDEENLRKKIRLQLVE
jgi:exoribonuclease R